MFCKNCGCEVDANAKFCSNCGQEIASSTNENAQAETNQDYQEKPSVYCKNCGSGIDPNALICPKCGFQKGTGSNFCHHCGNHIIPEAKVCMNCGYENIPAYPAGEQKSKLAAGLLGIFLGVFGVHNFYLGNTGKAVGQLILGILGCTAFISGIWGLIEGIMILAGKIDKDAKGIPLGE